MSYDRRQAATTVPSFSVMRGKWLAALGAAIVERGRALNRHMQGKVIPKDNYRVDVDFEGETLGDMPAGSYALISVDGNGTVTINCQYKSADRGDNDAKWILDRDNSPEKTIENVAKFLVGWMP